MCKETIKGHMVQTRQHVRSTKPTRKYNSLPAPVPEPATPEEENDTSISNEVHIKTTQISKLYTDETGRFPATSRTGNQYIMVEYHCDANEIIAVPFKSRKDKDRIVAYNSIMQRLKDRNMLVNPQILDNEASKEYKAIIKDQCKIKYQLVTSHIHRQTYAKRAIRTFKENFLSILAGVANDFPFPARRLTGRRLH